MSRLRIAGILFVSFAWVAAAHGASLYKEGAYQSLTSDSKARRIGDLITVMVYEDSTATSTANTTASRDANVAFSLDGPVRSRGGGIKVNNQTDGQGQTQRGGHVLAQITVSVKGIAENGDLLIGGEQLVEVNNEKQQIKVAGRIRVQDISDTNTVLSTRIANAKISYVGEGDLADKQRPAWWQRFLTLFGL